VGSLYVAPRVSNFDAGDDAFRDSVLCGNVFADAVGSERSLDSSDDIIRKFGVAVVWASSLSPLGNHVGDVVGVGAGKQVVGVAARTIVTAMQYVMTGLNWTERAFISNPMCAQLASPLVANDAVSVPVLRALPRPAFVWAGGTKVAGEALGQRNQAGGVTTGLGAERMLRPTGWSQSTLLTQRAVSHTSIIPRTGYVK
jgi:hypothetical protein